MTAENSGKGRYGMSFTAVFRPGMEDLGAGMLVKNRSLLRFCEDTAGFHTDTEGVGTVLIGYDTSIFAGRFSVWSYWIGTVIFLVTTGFVLICKIGRAHV